MRIGFDSAEEAAKLANQLVSVRYGPKALEYIKSTGGGCSRVWTESCAQAPHVIHAEREPAVDPGLSGFSLPGATVGWIRPPERRARHFHGRVVIRR